jgi:sugar lactone lactonase YvrE
MMRRLLSSRLIAAAVGVAFAGAAGGVLTALLLPDDESITAPGAEAEVINAPDGQPMMIVQDGDPRITFPAELSGLGVSIEKLAIDQAGNVWVPAFSGGDSGHALYRYDPVDRLVAKFALPDRPGSALSSGVGVSPEGEVVLAYGGIVTVMDPVTGAFRTYDLPGEAEPGGDVSTHVTDLAVGPDGAAYVTRENVMAVTEVDLKTGAISELPITDKTGRLFDVEVADQDIYVAYWVHGGDLYDGSTGGTRVLRLSSDGTQQELEGSTWALAATSDGIYSIDLKGEVRAYRDRSSTATPETQVLAAAIDGRIAIDANTGNVWVSGREADLIALWDRVSPSVSTFELPLYEVAGHLIFCPVGAECKNVTMHTAVGALAVAPNGDLYFTDNTMQRIGVIHADN